MVTALGATITADGRGRPPRDRRRRLLHRPLLDRARPGRAAHVGARPGGGGRNRAARTSSTSTPPPGTRSSASPPSSRSTGGACTQAKLVVGGVSGVPARRAGRVARRHVGLGRGDRRRGGRGSRRADERDRRHLRLGRVPHAPRDRAREAGARRRRSSGPAECLNPSAWAWSASAGSARSTLGRCARSTVSRRSRSPTPTPPGRAGRRRARRHGCRVGRGARRGGRRRARDRDADRRARAAPAARGRRRAARVLREARRARPRRRWTT